MLLMYRPCTLTEEHGGNVQKPALLRHHIYKVLLQYYKARAIQVQFCIKTGFYTYSLCFEPKWPYVWLYPIYIMQLLLILKLKSYDTDTFMFEIQNCGMPNVAIFDLSLCIVLIFICISLIFYLCSIIFIWFLWFSICIVIIFICILNFSFSICIVIIFICILNFSFALYNFHLNCMIFHLHCIIFICIQKFSICIVYLN